jgi:hypothetical protein
MDEFVEIPNPSNLFPELTTKRLLMYQFYLEDAHAVFNILRREEVN